MRMKIISGSGIRKKNMLKPNFPFRTKQLPKKLRVEQRRKRRTRILSQVPPLISLLSFSLSLLDHVIFSLYIDIKSVCMAMYNRLIQ